MITILVPIYNVEVYIGECVRSLMEQTYADCEYVFYDDCTPDNSIARLLEIVERYPERRNNVKVIRGDRNRGLGAARARLVQEVTTDFFCIVDSDDCLAKDALQILMDTMNATNADVVDGAYDEYNNGNLSLPHLPYHGTENEHLKRVLCQNLVSNRVWGRLYRTSFFMSKGPLFHEGIDYSEDFCCTARLMFGARRAWTDKVVYHYRTDNMSSYTKTVSEKSVRSYIRACDKVWRYYKAKDGVTFALEIGMLNAYREPFRNKMGYIIQQEGLSYETEKPFLRFIKAFLTKSNDSAVADCLYRLIRAIAVII